MRKTSIILVLLVFSLLMIAGCGRGLSGTYTSGSSSFTFYSDGTFDEHESNDSFQGKYTIDGDVITLNVFGMTDIMKFTDNPDELESHGKIYKKE
ncbi:MAG: hypothetical protein ACM3NJ_00230 [Methanobacterium sp.]